MTARPVRVLLLAAGLGTRLRPISEHWPKCLMPIGRRPLLEHWLLALRRAGVDRVMVNTHHHAKIVEAFLDRPGIRGTVQRFHEPVLLGTAGTLRANADFFRGCTTLLVHADNWVRCDLGDFLDFHRYRRPPHCAMTMMTFSTDSPQSCGIVETDEAGVVTAFHEKVGSPPGNRANGAVYLLEPEVLEWLLQHPVASDFSTQVIPAFIGRIATWHNGGVHRDIGTPESLLRAQDEVSDDEPCLDEAVDDAWQVAFRSHLALAPFWERMERPQL